MKKHEFLRELENSLKGKLSETDLREILSDYDDVFEDGLLDNRDEDEISESIGSPASISKAIIDDSINYPISSKKAIVPDTSNLAPMSKRFLAYLIDTVVIVLVFVGLMMIIFTPGVGFSETTITGTSNPGGTDSTQKIYLDNNINLKKVTLYKDNKKIFSGNKHDFDKFMEDNLDITINSVETIQKNKPFFFKASSSDSDRVVDTKHTYSYRMNERGMMSGLFEWLVITINLSILMGMGFGNGIIAFELWLFKGYTLGKWITKIKVVKSDDSKLTFWDVFLRDFVLKFALAVITGGLLNIISFIMGSATPDHKTVHDLVAKTKVINIERGL